jgi:hypothetical protein
MTPRHLPVLLALPLAAAALLTAGCGHHNNASPSTTFTFSSATPAQYAQIDRVGMPGVNTAVITSKDAYNAATPADDGNPTAGGLFVSQIVANVTALDAKLATSITASGLSPASASTSINQAAPHILPDVLTIDTTVAAGFPNGRMLADPVMDITLALILLDKPTSMAWPFTLANLPLNPPANDKPFLATFPYLATPH